MRLTMQSTNDDILLTTLASLYISPNKCTNTQVSVDLYTVQTPAV